MCLDKGVLGFELQAATMGTIWYQAKDTSFGHYFFMRAIYVHGEIDALYDEDAV